MWPLPDAALWRRRHHRYASYDRQRFLPIRTRFAPSPTGFLHLAARARALFSWAFARHHQGTFVLRIEDTDVERSTPEAVQAILDSMDWLGMQPDEGPFYQMQRMDRYREVVAQMLAAGTAYHCYSSPEEVEAMREAARARGDKPRYDGTWRPEPGKTLPPVPAGRQPVVRFKNPQDGATSWNDMVKGVISFDNTELDDLIIARPDGTPTYNFCVVVDDWDMGITHVLRGDDHVNNTPRQINILRALGAALPEYGHVPMILGPDGEKLSAPRRGQRHGIRQRGLPARGHDQLPGPPGLEPRRRRVVQPRAAGELVRHPPPVQVRLAVGPEEAELGQRPLHQADGRRRAGRARRPARGRGGHPEKTNLPGIMGLLKDRAETLEQLADGAMLFCGEFKPAPAELAEQHLTPAAREALADFAQRAQGTEWTREALSALIKAVLADRGLKMPQLAILLRVAVVGQTQTPAVDAVLALLGKETVLARLASV